jgi:hypothetical protein
MRSILPAMITTSTTETVESLRSKYGEQRSKYEAFYKEMNMLINEDISYVPADLYDLRTRVSASNNAGESVIDSLRAELITFYTKAGITAPANANSMTPNALLDDINTKLGFAASDTYSDFSTMLDNYDLTITDHVNFEREMILLGSNVSDLRKYSRAQQNINTYIDKMINYLDTNGNLGDCIRGGATGTNGTHLRNELIYWKTHHNYYDFYSLTASETGKGDTLPGDTSKVSVEYGKYYSPWRDSMIFKKYFYDKYMEAKVKESVDDTGLSILNNVYSVIILGPANHFGHDDLNDTATACIKRYADAEGKIILFHDTIDTAKMGTRSPGNFGDNIAEDLRETFGLDARHLVPQSTEKELIQSRTITATVAGTDITFDIDQQRSREHFYRLSMTPPAGNSKTYVYVVGADNKPTKGTLNGTSVISGMNVNDWRVKPLNNGGFNSNVNSITGTLRFGESNELSDINVNTSTGSNVSSVNLNFTINRTRSGATSVSDDTYYVVVCNTTDNDPFVYGSQGDKYLKAKGSTILTIKSGDTVNASIGVAQLEHRATTSNGTISGYTSDGNKQTLSISIAGDGFSSLIGTPVTFTDANGLNETVTFRSGEYNDESVAKATLELDNWKIPAGASITYAPKNGDTDRYFLSALATDGSNNINFNNSKNLVTTAITNRTVMSKAGTGYNNNQMNRHMFRFGMYDADSEGYFNTTQTRQDCLNEFKSSGKRVADDKVGVNNQGLITKYPFSLPDQFIITSTHAQAFVTDVEDSAMTVYFSFIEGSNGTMSQMHAADPLDGSENYFIYQYNSTTYCGAGHMNVTGFGTNNREERKLYINVIVNQLHKSAIGTQVKLYDENATNEKIENGTANTTIKPDGLGNYTLEVKDSTSTPAFSVKALLDSNEKITRVRAWYDLDLVPENINHPFDDPDGLVTYDHKLFYDTNGGTYDIDGDGTEETITAANEAQLAAFSASPVNVNMDAQFRVGDMQLKQEYFDAYDGMHTYIVVCVTTERKGKVYNTYRKIRINLKPYMFDLT